MSSAGNHHLHHPHTQHEQQHGQQEHPWAHLVGKHKDEAAEVIRKENPSYNVQIVPKVSQKYHHFC